MREERMRAKERSTDQVEDRCIRAKELKAKWAFDQGESTENKRERKEWAGKDR